MHGDSRDTSRSIATRVTSHHDDEMEGDEADSVETALSFLFTAADRIDKGKGADDTADAIRLLETCVSVAAHNDVATAAPGHLNPANDNPPLWMIAAVGWNKLGEVHCDTGHLDDARGCFREAVELWEGYGSPRLSLAQLDREAGAFASALDWFKEVRTMPCPSETAGTPSALDGGAAASVAADTDRGGGAITATEDAEGEGDDRWEWHTEWAVEPWTRCRAVAAYHEAHLLSRLGRHDEAATLLRCDFGVKCRIAPEVWTLSQAPRTAGGRRQHQDPGPAGPRFFRDAVPPRLGAALRRGFAPTAPYWTETGYDSREYFRWVGGARFLLTAVHPLTRPLAPSRSHPLTRVPLLRCALANGAARR